MSLNKELIVQLYDQSHNIQITNFYTLNLEISVEVATTARVIMTVGF